MDNELNPAVAIDKVLAHLGEVSIEMMSQEADLGHIAEQLLKIFILFKEMPGADILVKPSTSEIELSLSDVPSEIGNGTVQFRLNMEVSFKLDNHDT